MLLNSLSATDGAPLRRAKKTPPDDSLPPHLAFLLGSKVMPACLLLLSKLGTPIHREAKRSQRLKFAENTFIAKAL